MNPGKYNKSAYRREVWREAARLLREACFPERGDPQPIECDSVFRAPREVPSDVIQEIIVALHNAEVTEERAMQRYQLEEMSDERIRSISEPLAQPGVLPAAAPVEKPKRGAVRRRAS